MHLITGLRLAGLRKIKIYLNILCVLSLSPVTSSAADTCIETYPLPPNQWHQISLPCNPDNSSIRAVFGDDVQGEFGKDWAIVDFDTASTSYRKLSLDHNLSQKKGYWIIQLSNSTTNLDIQGQSPASTQSITLETIAGSTGWNMIGYPYNREQSLNKTRVITDSPQCLSGCNLNDAKNKNLVHNTLWHFNPATNQYVSVDASSSWTPWSGYWAATLVNAHGSNPLLSTPTPSPLSIMLLGDSITQSTKDYFSYRYYLWKKLLDSDVNFDFVGSMTTNHGGNPQWPNHLGRSFDSDHQSHWGLRADEVFNILKQKTHKPNIVLLHLGTNDEIQGQSEASTKNDLRNIVANLRGKNPRVIVFLAKIIPYRTTLDPILNNSLTSLVSELNTVDSPVLLVDQHSGFDVNADTFDRVHPNNSGEKKLANRWYDAIIRKVN